MKRVSVAKWHEKHHRWQINVQKNGIRRSFYSSIPHRAGLRACHEKADRWLESQCVKSNQKIQYLYGSWIDEIKIQSSIGYWGNYEGYGRNWILPEIGNKKIENVTEQDFQNIINAGFAKGLSKKTLSNMAACCRCFLKYCRKQKATSLLLEHLAVPRNAPSGKRTILQPNDLSLLFSRNTTIYNREEKYEPFVYAFRFQVLTGVRPGELLGLKWNDIDFVRRLITLERSINSHREFTTGKNCNAQRSFCMTDDCYHLILKHEQINGRESEYVFSLNGKFIRPGTYYDRWIKYRDYHQICHASPYELRHTFISIIKALPLGLIKPLVGHSINMDTYRVYGHELEGEKQKTAVLVQQQFHKVANFSAEHSSEEDLPGYSDQ